MKETVCILSLPAESRGLGGNPMTRKIQKITPEWQSEPFFCSVGSAVARVKGKHHDGDAAKLGGILCRQFRWYRELFRPVGMKGFFYIDNQSKISEVSEKHKGKKNKLREKHTLKGKSFLRRN